MYHSTGHKKFTAAAHKQKGNSQSRWSWLWLAALVLLLVICQADAVEGDPETGAGQLHFDNGNEALHLGTDVKMRIQGLQAEVEITQRFHNTSDNWVNATYTYPMADDSAVSRLTMIVGERIIEGEIQEKAQARATYERARAAGQRTTLVEQQRPNLFRQQVANIGPDETITIKIGYTQQALYDSGEFRLRLPMTLTPRYIPGVSQMPFEQHQSFTTTGTGWALPTNLVADAHLITPPQKHAAAHPLINPITIDITLNPGMALTELASDTHRLDISEDNQQHRIRFADGQVSMDRDFELRWTPEPNQAPVAALFHDHWQNDDYVQLLLMPPQELNHTEALPREMLLVIDVSGSMAGTAIEQARASALMALDKLASNDRFNVIIFNQQSSQLFNHAMPANSHTLDEARRHIQNLNAGGGTEFLAALKAAFAHKPQPSHLQQIVFVTDGSVGNEEAVLQQIQRHVGNARLFTVAIGSAPNRFLLRRAADFGRGSFTEIANPTQVQARMKILLDKLQRPVVAGLNIDWPQPVEMYPRQVPDLYWGEPLIVTAKLPPWPLRATPTVRISGESAGKPWTREIPLALERKEYSGEGIPVLAQRFGRDKIAFIENQHFNNSDQARDKILPVALGYQLMSRYTSLVAVDKTPAREPGATAEDHTIANAMPAGSAMQAPYPQTATGLWLHLLLGLAAFLALLLLRIKGGRYAH